MKLRVISIALIAFLGLLTQGVENAVIDPTVISKNGRDFVNGLLTTVVGIDFKLSDKCLGADFDSDFNKLIDAINKENTFLVAVLAEKIYSDAKDNCPDNELKKIYTDVKALYTSGNWIKNIMGHSKDIIHSLKEEINQPVISAKNAGQTVGKLVNIVVYSKSHNIRELDFLGITEEYTASEDVEEFVNGFFEGVSSVPFDQNKCFQDISSVKSEIVDAFTELINAIKSRSDILEAFEKLFELAKSLSSIDANCKFHSLALDLAALGTNAGMAKAVFRVTTHIVSVISDIRGILNNLEENQYRQSGVDFGSLVKIVLNYSTI